MKSVALAFLGLAIGLVALTTPPYRVDGPATGPRMFGEGVISTGMDEFGASFMPDGRTVFFSMSVGHHAQYFVCLSRYESGRWTTPVVAPFSGKYWDFDAFVSPDGARVYFASDRPRRGQPDGDHDFNIWYVERDKKGWSDPIDAGDAINSDADESFASVTRDGTLYFTSDRENPDTGEYHFYRSRFVDGRFASAEKLPGPLNEAKNGSLEITVSPDERFAFLTCFQRSDGLGLGDLYVSRNQSGIWSEPENLGPKVNTPARDYSARISPDGKYLFYASENGFSTDPRDRPISDAELRRGLRSIRNGWGNIYQIELSALGLEVR